MDPEPAQDAARRSEPAGFDGEDGAQRAVQEIVTIRSAIASAIAGVPLLMLSAMVGLSGSVPSL